MKNKFDKEKNNKEINEEVIEVNEKQNKNRLKKFRSILVFLSLIIIGIIILFFYRSEYLNYLDAGSQYLKIFKIRSLEKTLIFVVNFILIYILMFFVTRSMQNNLKELFKNEKKDFPNLPTKSISFIISLVVSLIIQFVFAGDFIKILNIGWFGKKDSILSLDYSYYIQIIPIIRKILIYSFAIDIFVLIYVVIYNILTINIKLRWNRN